jgi:hypothetical protein
LVGDDEDDGLDDALEVRCEKSGTILYFPFFMKSFVIGFAIVEISSVVIKKKPEKANQRLFGPNEPTPILSLGKCATVHPHCQK